MVLHAAYSIDRGDDFKYRGVDGQALRRQHARTGSSTASIQVHGALGYSTDTPLASMFQHARWARFADGADEIHQMRIAQRTIAAYRDHGIDAHRHRRPAGVARAAPSVALARWFGGGGASSVTGRGCDHRHRHAAVARRAQRGDHRRLRRRARRPSGGDRPGAGAGGRARRSVGRAHVRPPPGNRRASRVGARRSSPTSASASSCWPPPASTPPSCCPSTPPRRASHPSRSSSACSSRRCGPRSSWSAATSTSVTTAPATSTCSRSSVAPTTSRFARSTWWCAPTGSTSP